MKNKHTKNQPSQTLAKALRIIELFSVHQSDWGIREIGRKTDINPTTVYRLVTTLHNFGYLDQNPETQRYSLGPSVVHLASIYMHHNPLPLIATQVFESYSDRFEYNFYLGTLREYKVVYLAVLDGRGPIKVVVEPGGTTTLQTTALGKVLLAFQNDDFINTFLETTSLDSYTSRSLQTPGAVWEEVSQIRQLKYAINDGEHYEDVGAVGVPIFDHSGEVKLGISFAYPRHLIQEKRLRIKEMVPLLQEMAGVIALRSGLESENLHTI